MKDFFISYNKADRAWAEWIAWHLEEAAYSVRAIGYTSNPLESNPETGWRRKATGESANPWAAATRAMNPRSG